MKSQKILPPPSSYFKSNTRIENRQTPYLTIDLDKIRKQYRTFCKYLPHVKCYYSIKSNPSPEIMHMLLLEGSRFEAASIGEIIKCINIGVDPSNIHFGNSVKPYTSIKNAFNIGVNSFAFDSQEELEKILPLKNANTQLICRLATDGEGATWGLCNKFGTLPEQAVALCKKAWQAGVTSLGLSFHVGSQQKSPEAWKRALMLVKNVVDNLNENNINIETINIGGGFPSSGYLDNEHNIVEFNYKEYLSTVTKYISEFNSFHNCTFMAEPGRFLLAEAGVLKTSVILATDRLYQGNPCKWLYLDIGKFNGLYEGTDISHPVKSLQPPQSKLVETALTGPSCDSDDMLMCNDKTYLLPDTIDTGDELTFSCTGAYSTSYASVEFNGFNPITVYYKDRPEHD